jgi:hypothetical protein
VKINKIGWVYIGLAVWVEICLLIITFCCSALFMSRSFAASRGGNGGTSQDPFQPSNGDKIERFELLTYYPAPYGVYRDLKASRQLWVGADDKGLPLKGGAPLLQVGGTTTDTCAIYGELISELSQSYGIFGKAIYTGNDSSEDGGMAGVYGEAEGINSIGVHGKSTGTGVYSYGVLGEASTGVCGKGLTGVYGEADWDDGTGVLGHGELGVCGKGTKVGIKGTSVIPETYDSMQLVEGAGVQGVGQNYGGYFRSYSTIAGVSAAVFGSGFCGVKGQATNSNGYAGYFDGGKGVRLPVLANDPQNPESGTIWVNSTSNKIKVQIGTQKIELN